MAINTTEFHGAESENFVYWEYEKTLTSDLLNCKLGPTDLFGTGRNL